MSLKKKKKIVVLSSAQSRLSEVFGASLQSIEFVDPTSEETPEEEQIEEANLSTDQVDCLNEIAQLFS